MDVSKVPIICECSKDLKPVDFWGDGICREPISSVKEMIKKYEPQIEQEFHDKLTLSSSSNGVFKNCSSNLVLDNPLYDDQLATTFRNINRNLDLQRCKGKVDSYVQLNRKPSELSNRQFNNLLERKKSTSKCDTSTYNSYKSKTSIIKTPKGVRIITDIFFNTINGLQQDNWTGRRIETDLAESKILMDFEKRNSCWEDEKQS